MIRNDSSYDEIMIRTCDRDQRIVYFLPRNQHVQNKRLHVSNDKSQIDYQSDTSKFGRGDQHLSAILDEKDVVVIQIGTWELDGVQLGDGNPAAFEYCVVETMQVIWTHNCEHGFIQGLAVSIDSENHTLKVESPIQVVDFGPEQLVARLPVQWVNDEHALVLVDITHVSQ